MHYNRASLLTELALAIVTLGVLWLGKLVCPHEKLLHLCAHLTLELTNSPYRPTCK